MLQKYKDGTSKTQAQLLQAFVLLKKKGGLLKLLIGKCRVLGLLRRGPNVGSCRYLSKPGVFNSSSFTAVLLSPTLSSTKSFLLKVHLRAVSQTRAWFCNISLKNILFLTFAIIEGCWELPVPGKLVTSMRIAPKFFPVNEPLPPNLNYPSLIWGYFRRTLSEWQQKSRLMMTMAYPQGVPQSPERSRELSMTR